MKAKDLANPWFGFIASFLLVGIGIFAAMQSGIWRYHTFVAFLALSILVLLFSSFMTLFWKDYKRAPEFAVTVIVSCLGLIAWFFTPDASIPPRQYFKIEIIYIASLVLSVVCVGAGLGAFLLKEIAWYRATASLFNLMLILFLASQLWLYIHRVV